MTIFNFVVVVYKLYSFFKFLRGQDLVSSRVRWMLNCVVIFSGKKLLIECGLCLAHFSKVTGKAFTQSCCKVTDTTARAITSTFVTVAAQDITFGGAFKQRAVGATVSIIAFASVTVFSIPSIVVLGGDVGQTSHTEVGFDRCVITGKFLQ